jgi:CheY-like chemotaxis protein
MITILLVAPEPDRLAGLAGTDSSWEVLFAPNAEEAVEKLARNRRIDAVLVMPFSGSAEAVAAITEELTPPPPLFAPASAGHIGVGVQALPDAEPARLLEAVAASLQAGASER